jgi:nitrogenase molybdenum-iron protein alpha/beta subunit
MIVCNSNREPTTTDKFIQKSQKMLNDGADKGKELLHEGENLLDEGVEKVKELF